MHLLSFIILVWRNPALASSLACSQLRIFFEQDWQDIPKQAAASISGTIFELTNLLHNMLLYSFLNRSLYVLQLMVPIQQTESKVQIFWEGQKNLEKNPDLFWTFARQTKLKYFLSNLCGFLRISEL